MHSNQKTFLHSLSKADWHSHTTLIFRPNILLLLILVVVLFQKPALAQTQALTWTPIDIGGAATGTYNDSTPGTYIVGGKGTGIGSQSGDSFRFVSTSTKGNMEMVAYINSQDNTSPYATAGLMIRGSTADPAGSPLDATAAMACITVSPQNGVNFTYRPYDGAAAVTTLGPSITTPLYVRLVRSGNSIAGYQSSDGISWQLVGSYGFQSPVLQDSIQAGFAVSSNVPGTLSQATFTKVLFMTNVPQRSANLALWLRADVGVTYTTANQISKWEDQSGNLKHATQATSANQPTLSTGALNDLPAVNFNGTSHFLSMPAGFATWTGATIFMVAKPTQAATTSPLDLGNGGANNDIRFLQITSPANAIQVLSYNAGASSVVTGAAGSFTVNQFSVVDAVQNNAGGGTLYTNAVQTGTGTLNNINNVTRSTNRIGQYGGGGFFFKGQIAEIIVYSTVLSGSQRQAVEAYLYSKYYITNSAPALASPTITPGGYRTFGSPVNVSISTPLPSPAQIVYTTDGSTPSPTHGTIYSAPFTVSSALNTVKAIVWQPSYSPSPVAISNIQIDPLAGYIATNGLTSWFKADHGVTSNGGIPNKVSQWNDVSGNNYLATQNTSGNQPALVGGLPFSALSFTTANAHNLTISPGFANFTAGASAFFITAPVASGLPANATWLCLSNGAGNNTVEWMMPTSTTSGLWVFNGGTSSNVTSTTGGASTSGWQIVEAVHNGNKGVTFFNNGTAYGGGTLFNINNLTRSSNMIGGIFGVGSYFNGYIAEILLYNRPVSLLERINIERYANAKYLNIGVLNSPSIVPGTGMYDSAQTVTMTSDPNTEIWYTTDGSTPAHNVGSLYSAPFVVSANVILKAVAYKSSTSTTSAVTTAILSFDTTTSQVSKNGLKLWLRSDTGVTSSGGSPDLVSQWLDLSGNNNSATQSTSANQPSLVQSALNGYPSINTNVVGHSSSYFNLPSGFSDFSGGTSMFLVVSPGSAGPMIDVGNGATSDNITFGDPSTATTEKLTVVNNVTSSNVNQASAITLNQFQLLSANHNGAGTGTIYVNGVLKATNAAMQNPRVINRTLNHIAANHNASSWFSGTIAEILLYDHQLSSTESAAVNGYLLQRYQIKSIPPAAPIFSSTNTNVPQQVAISAPPNCQIYFTIDGSTPSAATSPLYSAPVQIRYGLTLKAISVYNGVSSSVTSTSFGGGSFDYNTQVLNNHLQRPTNAH